MKQAIIDIGSNSIRLKCYEIMGNEFKVLFRDKIMAVQLADTKMSWEKKGLEYARVKKEKSKPDVCAQEHFLTEAQASPASETTDSRRITSSDQ